jgi:hypothetical protein
MECKICTQQSKVIFSAKILYKYNVKYYQCSNCQFIQTEKPYWLDEAYGEAITSSDIGYITRNIMYSEITASLIKFMGMSSQSQFLDYGGGYGMFVRLMRDKGFNFYRQDLYCENLFSKYLDIDEPENSNKRKFSLLTSFEVFEHLDNPMAEIEKMFQYADNILFSTELQPTSTQFNKAEDWWYFAPETGQHIAFFSSESLKELGSKFNCHCYTNNGTLHLLTKNKFYINPVKFVSIKHNLLDKLLKRNFSNPKSLIQKDFKQVKQYLGTEIK